MRNNGVYGTYFILERAAPYLRSNSNIGRVTMVMIPPTSKVRFPVAIIGFRTRLQMSRVIAAEVQYLKLHTLHSSGNRNPAFAQHIHYGRRTA